ncbi:uncharacterized protein LOC110181316 [Drosophila serrata]|uniref:uncharacterized protein LOC110181316 n=1 Tax=Drosophila serrata TaxID=7274 RepID=UPI000A1D13B6|nr:uncharacterized protein LOC110181316 [Drosophila serrata]
MGEKSFRKLGLAVILSALVLYLYLFIGTQQKAGKIRNAFFVNAPGCRIEAMDVMNPRIAKYFKREWPHRKFHHSCLSTNWFHAEVMDRNWYLKLVPDMDRILDNYGFNHEGQIHCYWSKFHSTRHLESTLIDLGRFNLDYPYVIKVPKDVLQLQVTCYNSLINTTLCDESHYFISPPPQNLLAIPPTSFKFWNKNMNTKGGNSPISVMIVGLDSVSHLQFLRQMPKTLAYIRKKTSHVEFWGFNKIGVNSYQNLIPMLTGLSEAESQKYWNWKKKLDDLPLIWKDYKAAGYNTSWGEDWAPFSMFHDGKPGFAKQTTDHNFHDLMTQVYVQQSRIKMDNALCFLDVLMEMNYKLLPHMQRYPFFSFYWWGNGVHDYMSRFVDKRFERFLKRLNNVGILNNTIIIFMSDHGIRWGNFRQSYQGMIEDSQPFLSILYPAWMRKKYPMAIKNLAGNSHSLVTTYDLHETLRHLLHPKTLEDESITLKSEELSTRNASLIPRGVSLFLPIPIERTCDTSHISSHFCLCHKQVAISVDNPIAMQSANIIVNSINKLIEEYPVCKPLQLESIVSAQFAVPESLNHINKKKRHKSLFYTEKDILVRLKVKPGISYFEGMTRIHKNSIHLIGDVVRLGGDNSNNNDCIQNPELNPFCYCSL